MISIPGLQNLPIEQMDLSGLQHHALTPDEKHQRNIDMTNGIYIPVFDQMKSEIRDRYPEIQSLGRFWRLKARGGLIIEHSETRVTDKGAFTLTFVTIQIKGKDYFRKWGPLS